MARLPTPVIEGIDAIWSEDWTLREKNFYSILGQAVRNRTAREKTVKEGEKTNKTD